MARDRLGRDEARARLAAQLPLEQKLAVATAVIDNDGDLGATTAQVGRLLAALGAAGPRDHRLDES
jgi:dephospho-CoA kinase